MRTTKLNPSFNLDDPGCVTILSSDELIASFRKTVPNRRYLHWDQLADPASIRFVRLFSDDEEDQVPRLLQSEHLKVESMSLQSKHLGLLKDVSCASGINEYLAIDGSGNPSAMPDLDFPLLRAMWVGGSRTPITLNAKRFPLLRSAQLCFGNSRRCARSIAELVPQLESAGLWGLSAETFQLFPEAMPSVTYLRILSSSVPDANFVARFPNLKIIHFQGCARLTDIDALRCLPSLELASFWWCPHVKRSMRPLEGAKIETEFHGTSAD